MAANFSEVGTGLVVRVAGFVLGLGFFGRFFGYFCQLLVSFFGVCTLWSRDSIRSKFGVDRALIGGER